MIARLKGLIDSVSADALIVDVNGVGYLVQASTPHIVVAQRRTAGRAAHRNPGAGGTPSLCSAAFPKPNSLPSGH